MTLCPGFGVGRGFAQFTIQNSKLKITYYEHQHSYHQGAGGAASGARPCAGAGTAGCRTAPPARGADPRGRFAGDVPAGARRSERAFAARRGRRGPWRRCRASRAAASSSLRRTPRRRSSAPWTSRRISATNTPPSNTCCWRSWPSAAQAADILKRSGATEKELIEADPHLPQGCDGRFADLRAAVRRAGQVCHQPQRAGALGQARPGDRA